MNLNLETAQYCMEMVQRDDHDRYLTVLHARASDRMSLFALYAFNAELAKTRESVSEPALGEIRLQWWREAIEELYAGGGREHPVLSALGPLCQESRIPQQRLQALIDGREADLYDQQPETLGELEAYAAATGGALQTAAATLLGADPVAAGAAAKVGTAWTLVGLMRALPYHLAQGRIYVPRAMMLEEGLRDPSRPDAEQSAALGRVLARIANQALNLIAEGRNDAGTVSRRAAPALRLAPLAEGYLKSLAANAYVPDHVNYDRGALGRQVRLAWAGLRGAY